MTDLKPLVMLCGIFFVLFLVVGMTLVLRYGQPDHATIARWVAEDRQQAGKP